MAGETIELSVVVHASRATVFRFFSDPARFARWWAGPGGGIATLEPQVGGRVGIAYHGGRATMEGKVLEMREPERFVMSWGYSSGNEAVKPGASRVEVTLREHPEGTLLTLVHSGLPSAEQAKGHEFGWRHYLAVVAGECAKDQFGLGLENVVERWFGAWTTVDPTVRLAMLRSAVEEDIEFRDAFSCVRGVERLNDHISNALRHMPGVTLERVGAAQQSHGFVRFAWRMAGADGKPVAAGTNFGRFGPSGKIASVVGFWDGVGQ